MPWCHCNPRSSGVVGRCRSAAAAAGVQQGLPTRRSARECIVYAAALKAPDVSQLRQRAVVGVLLLYPATPRILQSSLRSPARAQARAVT